MNFVGGVLVGGQREEGGFRFWVGLAGRTIDAVGGVLVHLLVGRQREEGVHDAVGRLIRLRERDGRQRPA